MKWEMEIEEIEAVLERIWDLHDKLSDEIHSISRSHFLNSIKNLTRSERRKVYGDSGDENRSGYVFMKGFSTDDNDSAIQEAKSLNAIRAALENLEDQLEFFHTIQTQQRAERDVAIARLEQSRIVLAMRLAEHHGKKYKVIEEALAFVGDIKDASRLMPPDNNLYDSSANQSGAKSVPADGKRSNMLIRAITSSFGFAKRSLKFNHMRGVLGNAALFTVSMIAMLHLHQIARGEQGLQKNRDDLYRSRRRTYQTDPCLDRLDVMMARG